jgi:phosphoribosylanthranilate isomerase
VSLWIKICGNTSLEDAQLAVAAGADAVGFVFAPSPRRVTAAQVATITPHLPAELEKIGVFVDAPVEEIVETVRLCGLTGVQMHSEAGPQAVGQLRHELGPGFRILRVLHFGPATAEQTAAVFDDANADAILVDSRSATAMGGTGIAFDWKKARETLFPTAEARSLRFVVAGGLHPENVAEAIATLAPWGVDVVSGVEAEPGRKDAAKVKVFVANARAAGRTSRPSICP